jgi:signal transduction histidine kinase
MGRSMSSDHPATAELLTDAIRAVAAAKRPRDAFAVLLTTVRAWTRAAGASLLWDEPEYPVSAANGSLADAIGLAERNALPSGSLHFPLFTGGRLEGHLLLANVAQPALAAGPDFSALLDLTALVLRDRRIDDEREQTSTSEAALEFARLRMLGQIASGVAHDLNQSLGLIAGHGDLALRALGEPSPNIAALGESVNIVVQAAMDGAGTVSRLLAFGRPALEGPAELVDLGELLGEVARLTAPRWRDAAQAEGRPIRLDTVVAGSTSIAGWRGSLGAALTNLILNAVDALPAGGAIRLAATRSGDQVIAEVTDTGTGMSPGVQARAFEPFFTTKRGRRTGLGLAMVFGIVERHGGSIALESSPGQGTTFRLCFSASNVADVRAVPSADPPPVVPLRVLAVDDEPALGRMLAQLLQLDGHQVVVANSGEAALGLLSNEPFDLVVADVGMGVGMNGWEFARQTLALYPATCFALVTGWGVLIDADEARASGIAAVLAKPYRLADLQRLVASVQARQRTATN